jgi:hypothetical protein
MPHSACATRGRGIANKDGGCHLTVDRRRWRRPTLIVLLRTRPEESILLACKSQQKAGPSLGDCHISGNHYCVDKARS